MSMTSLDVTVRALLDLSFKASLGQPIAALGPATFEIVPAPVIETYPQLLFGSGEGSGGCCSERPTH